MKNFTLLFFLLLNLSMLYAQEPKDLISNVSVTTDWTTVTGIENTFNQARRQEEIQLGLCPNSIRDLDLPSQAIWDAYSDDQKALVIMNDDRTSRGNVDYGDGPVKGLPFNGIEANIDAVAQNWSQYQADNNLFGHCLLVNGVESCPGARIAGGYPAGCTEFGGGIENIFASSGNIASEVALLQAIFGWTYTDGPGWGHRRAQLSQSYDDDYGTIGQEGFVGFGIAYNPAATTFKTVVTVNFTNPVADADAGACGYNLTVPTNSVVGCLTRLTITSPNGGESLTAGGMETITWNATTCGGLTNVNILLSIDGGISYPFTLASNTSATDGTETITIPAGIPNTSTARIRIEKTGGNCGNYSVSSAANFTINSGCLATSTLVCPADSVSFPAGNSGLDFTLNTEYFGTGITSWTTNSTSATPQSSMVNSNAGNCNILSNWAAKKYKILEFKVTKAGLYNFSIPGFNQMVVFTGSGFNPNSLCDNFLQAVSSGPNLGGNGNMSNVPLSPCNNYQLVVWFFSAPPQSITVSLSGPGAIYTPLSPPAGDYAYTFAAVNRANNLIAAVSATSDFTTLSDGDFWIYGATYFNGTGTNPPPSNPITWVNQSLSQVLGTGNCVTFSNNRKPVNISLGALPIELSFFRAQANDEKEVELSWQTSSELNNDFFTIEKSSDGIHFEFLEEISGKGTTNQLTNYLIYDKNPFDGLNYYRLKQTDFDGAFEYFEIRVVEVEGNDIGFEIYPNPTNGLVNIRFSEVVEKGNILLFDGVGKLILEKIITENNFQKNLDLRDFPKGIYWIKIITNNTSYNKKIIVQ